MRYKIENLTDLDDSKSFIEAYKSSCSYHFLKYIMYIIVFTILAILLWSMYAEKEVVVHAFGEIDVNDNVCHIYIENTSIGGIKENDNAQIEIVSLSKNEYGVVNSTINNISNDILVDENSKKKYYTADCLLKDNVLRDRKGGEVELKNGMEAKVSIITYKTSYFNYLIEKLK